jgi:hypothetical protein
MGNKASTESDLPVDSPKDLLQDILEGNEEFASEQGKYMAILIIE